MAEPASKIGDLIEIVWSLLILLCMSLALAHVAWAARSQTASDTSLIEQTFTTRSDKR
jgi:hypothetical protein